jgi:hypothetical protein
MANIRLQCHGTNAASKGDSCEIAQATMALSLPGVQGDEGYLDRGWRSSSSFRGRWLWLPLALPLSAGLHACVTPVNLK